MKFTNEVGLLMDLRFRRYYKASNCFKMIGIHHGNVIESLCLKEIGTTRCLVFALKENGLSD